MIGFLTGVSINVILSQLGDFTGYSSEYSNKVVKAVDTLLHLNQIDMQTLAIGLLTVAVILLMDRTRLRNFSMLFGMVIGTAALLILGWTSVQQVSDVATIPGSLPMPKLPDFSLIPALWLDAIALAIIALIQGAGVSKGYPNPDGAYPDSSRDFIGQGAANLGASLFQGMPIGGSVSTHSAQCQLRGQIPLGKYIFRLDRRGGYPALQPGGQPGGDASYGGIADCCRFPVH